MLKDKNDDYFSEQKFIESVMEDFPAEYTSETDSVHDESTMKFSGNCSLSHESVGKLSDNVSENTSSSFETEFVSILYCRVSAALVSAQFSRSTGDLAILSQFLQTIPEFMNMSHSELELACQAAKLLSLSPSDSPRPIIKKCSAVRCWLFCLEGALRREEDDIYILGVGEYLGADLTSTDILISNYDLFCERDGTKLLQIDMDDLQHFSPQNNVIVKKNDVTGASIAVYEVCNNNMVQDRLLSVSQSRSELLSYVLTKATPEVLLDHLLTNANWTHACFVEDYFLTMLLFVNGGQSRQRVSSAVLTVLDHVSQGLLLSSSNQSDFGETVISAASTVQLELIIRCVAEIFPGLERATDCLNSVLHICDILRQQGRLVHLYSLLETCSSAAKTRNMTLPLCTVSKLLECLTEVAPDGSRNWPLFYVDGVRLEQLPRETALARWIRPGDVLVVMDGFLQQEITADIIRLSTYDTGSGRHLELSVRSDLLGYHTSVVRDVQSNQTQPTFNHNHPRQSSPSRFSRCLSDRSARDQDSVSISTTGSIVDESDSTSSLANQQLTVTSSLSDPLRKRPSILPNIFAHLQIGTVGRYFKKPKNYTKKFYRIPVLPHTYGASSAMGVDQQCHRHEYACGLAMTHHTFIISITCVSLFIIVVHVICVPTIHIRHSTVSNGIRVCVFLGPKVQPPTSQLQDLMSPRTNEISASNLSLTSRYSKRIKSKRRRRSAGSNPDLIQRDAGDSTNEHAIVSEEGEDGRCSTLGRTKSSKLAVQARLINSADWTEPLSSPLRIHWKPEFLGGLSSHSSSSVSITSQSGCSGGEGSQLRQLHVLIDRTTSVTETLVMALLQLKLNSACSSEFFLVEVTVSEPQNFPLASSTSTSHIIREKILRHTDSNLIHRLKSNWSYFYLKHQSYVGCSLMTQTEASRLPGEHRTSSVGVVPADLVVRMFLHSHGLLARLHPVDVLEHVTAPKSANGEVTHYTRLSDFYRCWAIWEVVKQPKSASKRALQLRYLIQVAVAALGCGHLDLFFSVVLALESPEVARLNQSWDKVPNKDKKLLQNLRQNLDVTGNLRNLRALHRQLPLPFVPVTGMFVKDLTVMHEAQATLVQVDNAPGTMVSVEKLRRMARFSRQLTVLPLCCCCGPRQEELPPTQTDSGGTCIRHLGGCLARPENEPLLRRTVATRLEGLVSQKSVSQHQPFQFITNGHKSMRRKHSFSATSIHSTSSSTENISVGITTFSPTTKANAVSQTAAELSAAFDRLQDELRTDRYFRSILDRVPIEGDKLNHMSMLCEPPSEFFEIGSTKIRSSQLRQHQQRSLEAASVPPPLPPNSEEIPEKALEMLGLKNKSAIHKFKKSDFC